MAIIFNPFKFLSRRLLVLESDDLETYLFFEV